MKLTKIKHKKQILKTAREKQQITYKGITKRLTVDLPAEALQARREWEDVFKIMRGKAYNQEYSAQQGYHSDSKEKSKGL